MADPDTGKGELSSTVAAFLRRVKAEGAKARRSKAKPLAPQGKVPTGIRGLVRRTGGRLQAERATEWERASARDLRAWVSRAPALAFSLALHLLAAVVLMNVVYFARHERVGQIFRVAMRLSPPGGAEQGDQDNGVNGKDSEDSPPAGPLADAADAGSNARPVALPPSDVVAPALPMRVSAAPGDGAGKDGLGGLYAGRGGLGRGAALQRYGGDGVSEQAVADGLAWLADHQSADGSWDPSRFTKRCPPGDPCEDGREEFWAHYFDGYRAAITGLATLGFLGAGFTHQDDRRESAGASGSPPPRHPYCDMVDRALTWLCRCQRQDGLIVSSSAETERAMYSHGMAGLAVIEAYSLTHDPRLRPHAQLAVNFCVSAQQSNGGWDYSFSPTGRGDTSVTSWQVMLLRAARAAGLSVPQKAWSRARKFMEKVTDTKEGAIGYAQSAGNPAVDEGCNAMVAAGWVTRAYLGVPDDHLAQQKFAGVLLKLPPRFDGEWGRCSHWSMLRDRKAAGHWTLYYTYYGTLAMFHYGGKAWEEWNARMRKVTLENQRTKGHEKGSWDPVTADASFGGRVYATAMNVINLEVYYRYLPVYEVGADFGLSPLLSDADWDAQAGGASKGTFHAKTPEPSETPTVTVETLLRDLRSEDMMTRRNAAKALSQRAEKSAIPEMIQAARAETTSLRPVLIEYLGGFGAEAAILDFLIGMLDSESDRLRHAAAEGLKRATGMDYGTDRSAWERFRRDLKPGK
jgi:hypothetical protein